MTASTNSTLGEVKLAGILGGNNNALAPEMPASGATAGSYTNPNITVDARGIITSVSNGSALDVFNTPVATAITKGIVQIGSGFNVSAGLISIPTATTVVRGVVSIGTGLVVSSGVVSVNSSMYPSLAAGGTFSGAVITTVATASITGSTTLNFSQSNTFNLTLTGNVTLNVPANLTPGGVYYIVMRQDAAGSRTCAFNSVFKFENGSSSVLSTAANSIDMIRVFVVSNTELVCRMYKNFV